MKWLIAVALLLVGTAALGGGSRRSLSLTTKAPGFIETVGNYEVVLPQITKSYKDKDYNQVHPRLLQVNIPTKRCNYSLILKLNKQLRVLSNFEDPHYFIGQGQEVVIKSHVNCFYQGWVEGHPDWRVTMSTCHGLQGFFGDQKDENNLFQVEPLSKEDGSVEQLHALSCYSENKYKQENHGYDQSRVLGVNEWLNFKENQVEKHGHNRLRRQSSTAGDSTESESSERENQSALLAGVAGAVGGILILLVVVTVVLFFITLSIRRSIPKTTFKPHYTVHGVDVQHTSSTTHTDNDSLEGILLKEIKDDITIIIPTASSPSAPVPSDDATSSSAVSDVNKLVPVRTAPQRPPTRKPPPLPIIHPPPPVDTKSQRSSSESDLTPPLTPQNGVSTACDEPSPVAPPVSQMGPVLPDDQTGVQKLPITAMSPAPATKTLPAATASSPNVNMPSKPTEAQEQPGSDKSIQKECDLFIPQLRAVPTPPPKADLEKPFTPPKHNVPIIPIPASKPAPAPKPSTNDVANVPAPKPKPKPKPLVPAEKPTVKPDMVVPPKPVVVLPKPAVVPPKPAVVPPKPAVVPPKPAVVPPKPVVVPPKPAVVLPKPAVVPPKPAMKPAGLDSGPNKPKPAPKPSVIPRSFISPKPQLHSSADVLQTEKPPIMKKSGPIPHPRK